MLTVAPFDMTSKRSLSLLILCFLGLFSLVSLAPALALSTPASIFSSGATCPASDTISFVTEPIPQSFNFFNPSGDSTFYVGSLEYLSLAPFPDEPNGSLDWSASATNWISSNANFTQWTLHIRPGLTWSNGTAVEASDIATWLSPSYALNATYDFVGLHTEVTGVQVVNSDTAIVNLNVSDAQFPNRASEAYYAPMVSPTDVAKGPADPLFGTAITDGAWYLSGYTSGSTQAILLPNPYWPGPKPNACEVQVTFVENAAQMVPFLASNTGDFAGPLVYGSLAGLQPYSNIKLHADQGSFGQDLVYNITQYPYNMTQFRQALAYAINSSAIVQQSEFSYGVAANNAQGEVPSSVSWYNPSQQQYTYNVTKSMQLLHQLGFTGGGSPSTPLLFPNGTAMSTTIYTDSSKAWDPNVALQVAGFFEALGINVQTQTLTTQNLGADYSSNAFNIRNNLVIYSSGGPYYFIPWLDGQQGCNIMGTPGCYGWQATPSADGQTHWEYPPSADVEYQSNLTALNATPLTNPSQEQTILNNIQNLNAEYLPAIMVTYPDEIFAYNTAHFSGWPSYFFITGGEINETMFGDLVPVTQTTQTTTSTSTGVSSTSTQSSTQTSTSSSSHTSTSSSSATASNTGTIEIVAGIVIVIIIIVGLAAYMVRRRPSAPTT